MKSNFLCVSVLFLAFFISTGFIFSTPSSIDCEENSLFQTNFVLQDTSKKDNSEIILDRYPEFRGGMKEFYQYIASSLNYPKKARRKKIQGKVFIQFVVDKDGSIIDVKVLQGVHPKLDEEALRVIRESPKWIPAMHEGKIVKARMNIPINFTIDD